MSLKDFFGLFCAATVVGALFVGWVALLNFPWHYSIYVALIAEVLFIIFLLLAEKQASTINGAGGWMSFGFFIGHIILFMSTAFFRILVFLWGLFE